MIKTIINPLIKTKKKKTFLNLKKLAIRKYFKIKFVHFTETRKIDTLQIIFEKN